MDVFSLDAMAKLHEGEFCLRVLIPLLKKLGYAEVKDWHGGSAEQGKDIICWKLDDLQHRRNLAIVAKAVNFGNNAARQDVCAQVAQSLNLTFWDKSTGDEQIVHDCWIITNKNIAVGNNTLLRGTLGSAVNPRVKILDGQAVWDLVVQHFPVELSQAIQAVTERIGGGGFATQLILGEVARPIAQFSVGNKAVVIGERYPGQLDVEPFTIKTEFAFPNFKAGRSKADELRDAEQGKGTASIPGEYIRRFDILESALDHASTILGDIPEKFTHIEITPIESRTRLLTAIELRPDEGDPVSLPYLDMIAHSRTKDSIMFNNEHQPIPTLVTLRLDFGVDEVTWSVSLRGDTIAAPLYLNHLRFAACLDRPGESVVTFLDPGLPLGRSRFPGRQKPETTPEMVDWVADLATIQARTGVPIYIPRRALSDDEIDTVEFLRFILKNPVVPQIWERGTFAFVWNVEQAREMLAVFTSSEELRFQAVETRTAELFDSTIPLGRVQQVMERARLADEAGFRRKVEELKTGDTEFSIELLPGSSRRAKARYLDWGALSQEEEDANNAAQVNPAESNDKGTQTSEPVITL